MNWGCHQKIVTKLKGLQSTSSRSLWLICIYGPYNFRKGRSNKQILCYYFILFVALAIGTLIWAVLSSRHEFFVLTALPPSVLSLWCIVSKGKENSKIYFQYIYCIYQCIAIWVCKVSFCGLDILSYLSILIRY